MDLKNGTKIQIKFARRLNTWNIKFLSFINEALVFTTAWKIKIVLQNQALILFYYNYKKELAEAEMKNTIIACYGDLPTNKINTCYLWWPP